MRFDFSCLMWLFFALLSLFDCLNGLTLNVCYLVCIIVCLYCCDCFFVWVDLVLVLLDVCLLVLCCV